MSFLGRDLGIRCLRYASFDDIALWTCLSLILLDWDRIIRQLVFFSGFGLCVFVIRKTANKIQADDRMHISLIWLIICALAADWFGLHYMVGGLLAGFAIDATWLGRENLQWIRKLLLYFMMPVFFLNTGLRTGWEVSGRAVLIMGLILFLIQAVGKIAGVWIAGKIIGRSTVESTILGWLLQTKGLIEIIFCSVLLEEGIISKSMFTALLLMALISTSATIPAVMVVNSCNNRRTA
jgi:Kef-type K+ transport system membrane component KefB